MRRIVKRGEPRALIEWKRINRKTPENLKYGGGGFPNSKVRVSLLQEQGYLCGYTMKAIASPAGCHIEHVIPQSLCTEGVEDIDYGNMLACYPPSNTAIECEYGAKRKDAYDVRNNAFLSPLDPAAANAFRFNDDGTMDSADPRANASIEVLNLNCAILCNDRAAAIHGFLLRRNKKELSAAAARRLAAEVIQPDAEGRLRPFCEALAQAALRYAKKVERRAGRLRGVRE